MGLLEIDPEGYLDELLGLKETAKNAPIIFDKFDKGIRSKLRGKFRLAYEVARITGLYAYKYHRKKLIGLAGISGGGLVASTTLRSPSYRQARSLMVGYRNKRGYKSGKKYNYCRPTKYKKYSTGSRRR